MKLTWFGIPGPNFLQMERGGKLCPKSLRHLDHIEQKNYTYKNIVRTETVGGTMAKAELISVTRTERPELKVFKIVSTTFNDRKIDGFFPEDLQVEILTPTLRVDQVPLYEIYDGRVEPLAIRITAGGRYKKPSYVHILSMDEIPNNRYILYDVVIDSPTKLVGISNILTQGRIRDEYNRITRSRI